MHWVIVGFIIFLLCWGTPWMGVLKFLLGYGLAIVILAGIAGLGILTVIVILGFCGIPKEKKKG